MKCPFCGHLNLQGEDQCAKCGEDLTAFDKIHPKDQLERSLVKTSLDQLQTKAPILVSRETPLKQVAEYLAQGNQCVLVIERESVCGIVTERDILFKFVGTQKSLENTAVSEIMTANPETLRSSDSIANALNKMAIGGYRHIPIIDDSKKIHVVSVRDILAFISESFPGTIGA